MYFYESAEKWGVLRRRMDDEESKKDIGDDKMAGNDTVFMSRKEEKVTKAGIYSRYLWTLLRPFKQGSVVYPLKVVLSDELF